MSTYLTIDDLRGKIPDPFLTEALDDNADGVIEAADLVIAQASMAVEALLAGRYQFPLPEGEAVPQIVTYGALILACEACYNRRGFKGDANPYAVEAAALRDQLRAIGEGRIPLAPTIQRAEPSGSLIGERSRVVSRSRFSSLP
ncbi:MAG: DUF1320 family protein [Chthoniobacteraceae bacterium]